MARKKNLLVPPQVELRGRVALTLKDRVDELYQGVGRFRSWNHCFQEVISAGLELLESVENKKAEQRKEKREMAEASSGADESVTVTTVDAPKEKPVAKMSKPEPDEDDFEIPEEAN